MADNITLNAGAGGVDLASDDVGGIHYQIVKLAWGALDAATIVTTGASALPVILQANSGTDVGDVTIDNAAGAAAVNIQDGGNAITVDWAGTAPPIGAGLEATALRVTVATDSTGVLSVDDNGGNLSIDWAGTAPPIGAGLEATALRVTLATDSTGVLSVDDNAGSLTVDNAALSVVGSGLEATALRVTIASDSTGVLSVDDNGGNISIDDGGNVISVDWNGTAPPIGAGLEATALRVTIATDSTGVLSIDDNAGSLTVDQATASNLNAQIVGELAHDAADSGNPIKLGAKAVSTLEGVTLVAANDRTQLYADLDGALLTRQSIALGDLVSERVSNTDGSSTAFTNFSAVADTKNYVCAYSVFNSSATAGYVDFRDGTAGSVLWTVPLPAGGGANIVSPFPLFKTSANTALAYDVSGALTTVYVSVAGFQSKVA